MGLTGWITGTKCAECGVKILGQKFPRVVFGSEMYVCGACEEKRKAEQKLERDAAEQRRQQELEAAIRGRSDADIAEVLSRTALRRYVAFEKEVSDITGGEIQLNRVPAFMFVLFAESSALQGLAGLQFDGVRLERIHELYARYAMAQFIHGTIRNAPPGVATEPIDRAAVLSEIVAAYRSAAEVHRKNMRLNGIDTEPEMLGPTRAAG